MFKEIDTDESGSVSKQELYAAFAKMGLVASAAEMLRLFREGDTDGNGRIDCDEFIALGGKVDVFAGAAEAFASKDGPVTRRKRKQDRIKINKGSQLGPILTINQSKLAFEVKSPNDTSEMIVEMVNSGSTAMYYEWERAKVSGGLDSTAVVDAATQFFAPNARGCILPGTTVPMRFTFRPSKPGIFQEEWTLQLTPPAKETTSPVLLRGVCLEAPEMEHPVRLLEAELARRKLWFAVMDILDRDVLPNVYATTIPSSVRVDAIVTPLVPPPPPPAPPPQVAAAEAAAAEAAAASDAAFSTFMAAYGTAQSMPPMAAMAAFAELSKIAGLLPAPGAEVAVAAEEPAGEEVEPVEGEEAAAPAPSAPPPPPPPPFVWSGDPYELEEALTSSSGSTPELWERFEAALQKAASTTRDVSKGLRLKHIGASCAQACMMKGADVMTRTRQLYSKSVEGVTSSSGSGGGAIGMGGVPMAWCWETGKYEKADEAEAVGEAAAKAKAEAKAKAAEAAAYAEWYKTASKRDKKKADKKAAEEAVVKAAEDEKKAEEDAKAAAIAAAEEEKRLADPVVQKEMAYEKEVFDGVKASVIAMLESFVSQAVAAETE